MKNIISNPIITSHHYYALPLAVICSDLKLKPWVYSEFVQWHTDRDRNDESVRVSLYKKNNEMFLYDPLNEVMISREQLTNGTNVIGVYKGILNDGQYIYDFIDHYYISSFHSNRHYIHDLLIYGYDDEIKAFHVYAYNGPKLAEFDIPYFEYEAAYNSDYQKSHLVCTVLYRKKDIEFRPDISRIGNHLLDYLDGINTYNRESPLSIDLYKSKFGLDVYDDLKYNLEYVRYQNLKISIPSMYCVFDHKRFMHERVTYLDKHTEVKCPNDLKIKFAEIEKAGQIMVMQVMKLNQKGYSSEIDYSNLMRRFDNMKELEKVAYTDYYECNRFVFENS